jgi:phosphopantetheinyl transferase
MSMTPLCEGSVKAPAMPYEHRLKPRRGAGRSTGVDEARDETARIEDAHQAAQQRRDNDKPFFWRVASGVLYAEMPLTRSIRPPLLSEWESGRVQAFRNRESRARWLGGRALAKVLVKERLGLPGIVEIREGADGEPLVYSDGFPMPDVWLSISVRHDRISCVLADRPVALETRQVRAEEGHLVDHFLSRGEQRTLRRALGNAQTVRSAGWAIKEAAQRAARMRTTTELRNVELTPDFGLQVGDAMKLDVLALRVTGDVAVAIVGRFLVEERQTVRIVLDDAAREDATPRMQAAFERSMVRARRIADARLRWSGLRPDLQEG